jgi:DNA polymerase V
MKTIFALVDCNNFYVSCERVFDPAVRRQPVVVLSNNDGCAISRSNEAKRIGIAMGAPIFKCQEIVKQHDVKVFSANFVLYGDMSNRVMSVLSNFTPNMEVYSIDEAFLSLSGFEQLNFEKYARTIQVEVKRLTGIPVSIGVAPTKTLAKVANHFAKDHPETGGVFSLMEEGEIDRCLAQTPVRELWGIGKEKAIFLNRHGIQNALELRNAPDQWIKKHLTVVTLRTVWELRGISCLTLEETQPNKKAIGTSRTFGYEVNNFAEMEEAVCAYIAKSAVKLRRQKSLAGYVQVYVETNPFKEGKFYRNSAGMDVMPPTADTTILMKAAKGLLKTIYRDGLKYKSCGVILTNLSPETLEQDYLFDTVYQRSPRKRLMEVVDRYNARTNTGKLFWVSEGLGKPWYMKQAHKSKRFTTRWDEILEIRI